MLLFLQVCCCLNGNIPQERSSSTSLPKEPSAPGRARLFGDLLETCSATFFSELMPRQKTNCNCKKASVAWGFSCQCCIYGFTIKQPLGKRRSVWDFLFLQARVGPHSVLSTSAKRKRKTCAEETNVSAASLWCSSLGLLAAGQGAQCCLYGGSECRRAQKSAWRRCQSWCDSGFSDEENGDQAVLDGAPRCSTNSTTQGIVPYGSSAWAGVRGGRAQPTKIKELLDRKVVNNLLIQNPKLRYGNRPNSRTVPVSIWMWR